MKHDLAQEWQDFEGALFAQEIVARAFGLKFPLDPDSADVVAWTVLLELGITAGRVVREPSYRISAEKARRDAELGRQTMHQAPLWRHPIAGEERGEPVLILPVGRGDVPAYAPCSHTLSRYSFEDEDDFLASIADLIAIPVDGSRPMSLTGHTIALAHPRADGHLPLDGPGKLTLYGSGKAWLEAAISNARTIAAETPPHLVEQIHAPFPPPTEMGALLIEPKAFEWRIARGDCAIPFEAKEIDCPDSRGLAQLIDAEMRKKDKPRTMPTVRGPALRKDVPRGDAEGAEQRVEGNPFPTLHADREMGGYAPEGQWSGPGNVAKPHGNPARAGRVADSASSAPPRDPVGAAA